MEEEIGEMRRDRGDRRGRREEGGGGRRKRGEGREERKYGDCEGERRKKLKEESKHQNNRNKDRKKEGVKEEKTSFNHIPQSAGSCYNEVATAFQLAELLLDVLTTVHNHGAQTRAVGKLIRTVTRETCEHR